MTAALANDNLDVPVTVAHGNAIWPITASFDGYAAVPPQLLVLSVPFAKGTLPAQGAVTVFDATDKPLATQQRVLAHWRDGSVRWLRLCFQSHHNKRPWDDTPYASMNWNEALVEMASSSLFLPWDYRVRMGSPPAPQHPVRVSQKGRRVTVSNGRIHMEVAADAAGFGFASVQLGNGDKSIAGALRFHMRFADGRVVESTNVAADTLTVLETGPLRATVQLLGRLNDQYAWETRLTLHADEPAIRAEHTLGGLGGIKDEHVDDIARVWLSYDTALGDAFTFRASGDVVDVPGHVTAGQSVRLEQVAPRFDPPRDFGYTLTVGGNDAAHTIARGGRSGGWLHCADDQVRIGVAVRHFHQKSPKAVSVASGGRCTIDLWPQGDVLRMSRARAITHEVLYAFQPARPQRTIENHAAAHRDTVHQDLPYRAFVRPIVPAVDHRYLCATGAFAPLIPAASSKLRAFETSIAQNFESWHTRHYDAGVHYGMMHFGDYITPLGSDNGGNPPRPHWRNHEWEFVSALLTHYVRRGDTRALSSAVEAYRHFLDVDLHYTSGANAYHGYGDIGEMHEEFIGPDWGHLVCTGLIDAYLFTGDDRALAGARRICDAAAKAFADSDTVTKTFRHIRRSVTWPMIALLRMYDVTGEQKYLDVVQSVVQLMDKHRELWLRDGSWLSALTLAFLEDYHRLTGEPIGRELFMTKIEWWLDQYYTPEKRTLGKREGGAEFFYGNELSAGGSLMLSAAPLGYAYELTGDEYYLQVAHQLLHEGMRFPAELIARDLAPIARRGYPTAATRSDGKWFSLINFYTHRLPTAFAGVTDAQYEQIRRAAPQRRESAGNSTP